MDSQPQRLTLLGRLVIVLVIGGCLYGAWWFLYGSKRAGGATPADSVGGSASAPLSDPSGATTIGIAMGTEKARWLEWAVTQFGQSREGRGIRVQLIPMGSLEGAQAVLNGD